MSWNQAIERKMTADVELAKKQIDENARIVLDRTPAAVLNLPGAASQVQTGKQAIETGIQTIQNHTIAINGIIDAISNETKDIRKKLSEEQDEEKRLFGKVEEEKRVYELRNDQALALKARKESNYHTSWIGLWRPLTEESRMGLYIAAIVFGIIGLLLIGFYLIQTVKAFPAFGNQGFLPNIFQNR